MAQGSASRRDRARRVVLCVRVGLGAVVVLAIVGAELRWESDPRLAYALEDLSVLGLVLIPLGGLVWWPVAEYELAPAVGRWLRALLGGGGLAVMLTGLAADGRTGLILLGAVLAAGSWLAPPLADLIRPGSTPPDSRPLENIRRPKGQGRLKRRLLGKTLFDPSELEHETLVSRPSAPEPTPCVIRPRSPGGDRPLGIGGWLRHGRLSTDGRSVSVTDRTGRVHRLPLYPAENGVAGMVAILETIEYVGGGRAWLLVDTIEELALVDATGGRLADIELYGWTREDLVEFAGAAGLTLERYWMSTPHIAYRRFGGKPPSPLQVKFPPARGYRRLPGRMLTIDKYLLLGVATGFVVTVALFLRFYLG